MNIHERLMLIQMGWAVFIAKFICKRFELTHFGANFPFMRINENDNICSVAGCDPNKQYRVHIWHRRHCEIETRCHGCETTKTTKIFANYVKERIMIEAMANRMGNRWIDFNPQIWEMREKHTYFSLIYCDKIRLFLLNRMCTCADVRKTYSRFFCTHLRQ